MNCFLQGGAFEEDSVNIVIFLCLFVQDGYHTRSENWHEHSALKVFLGVRAPLDLAHVTRTKKNNILLSPALTWTLIRNTRYSILNTVFLILESCNLIIDS